ncbi:hypothetical protein OCU04_000033 [Sclerotinia nivalis]|uniref:Uncharacterized protein n=1 Tax=Sclerotinia nivalis TaxID=352851 RepID=A0A9X0AVR6_9HELO|nr:hypothetical protein OCU04_000033 [Sclerotinia nivalis]
MPFNPSFFGNNNLPYISPYSSSSSDESARLFDEAVAKVEETHQYKPTLYEASAPRRITVPAISVTAATPVAPLQTIMAISLVPVYDFYYPAQTLGNLPPAHLLDPRLFAGPKPATTYSGIILPQLRELIANIKCTTDTHLMMQLPRLVELVTLLSQFPNFGLGTNNLAAFRKYVESFFATAHTKDEDLAHIILAVKPEKDLKMVFRILDDLYTYNFPRRAACLIYPDDFVHKPGGEIVSEKLACLFPDQYEADIEPSEPLLLYKEG